MTPDSGDPVPDGELVVDTEELELQKQKEIALELDRIFDHHPPPTYIIPLHEVWRTAIKRIAISLMNLPPTRERAMAITRLEETSMWIQACIARNHDAFPEPNDSPEEDSDG